MKHITAFSFGYWGWGNSTERLVQAIDSVERSRGFKPPVFVDTRINRSVRAVGFNGNAFGSLVGANRYHWMNRLGNERIRTRKGPRIKIADPSAAEDLLDLILDAARDDRRVIFFCGCEWPKWEGKINCHRTRVGTLLRSAAKRRGKTVHTVEWPGGKPQHFSLDADEEQFRSVSRGLWSIPVGTPKPLGEWASIGWGSIVTVLRGDERIHRLVGPIKWEKGQWALPIHVQFNDPGTALDAYRRDAATFRRKRGLIPYRAT